MRAGDLATVLQRDDHAVAHPLGASRTGTVHDLHAASPEDVFDHGGGVGVLTRKHPIT